MSDDSEHLANLSDGAGCAEVWEHLSEQRDADATEDADDDTDAEADAAADADEPAEDAPEQDAALTA